MKITELLPLKEYPCTLRQIFLVSASIACIHGLYNMLQRLLQHALVSKNTAQ